MARCDVPEMPFPYSTSYRDRAAPVNDDKSQVDVCGDVAIRSRGAVKAVDYPLKRNISFY